MIVDTPAGPVLVINQVEIGQRLKQVREHMGYETAKQFAEEVMQTGDSTWNAYETGRTMFPVSMAIKLVKQCPGLTFDWIYRRRASGLSAPLWRAFGMPLDVFDD